MSIKHNPMHPTFSAADYYLMDNLSDTECILEDAHDWANDVDLSDMPEAYIGCRKGWE